MDTDSVILYSDYTYFYEKQKVWIDICVIVLMVYGQNIVILDDVDGADWLILN